MSERDLGRKIRDWAAVGATVVQVGRGLWDALKFLGGRRKAKTVRAPLIRRDELVPPQVIELSGGVRNARVTKK